jgi:hypothetical protein
VAWPGINPEKPLDHSCLVSTVLCAILGLDASQLPESSEEKYRITKLGDCGKSWEILGEVGRFWEKLRDIGKGSQ